MYSLEKMHLIPLQKAIFQLEESLFLYHADSVQKDPRLAMQLRAAAIKAFAFTYEEASKIIKRYLNLTVINSVAKERGLLNDIEKWKKFHQKRMCTNETYNKEKAEEVFEIIPAFLEEAKSLVLKLNKRI